MKISELGIDPNRGGCSIVCSGQVTKNEPWGFTDEKTGEYKEGHSLHVAYFGGTFKVQTLPGDPLRNLAPGTSADLLIPCADSGGRLKQMGPAKLLNTAKAS